MLSLLPTAKDANKTSKLSKRWKHLWPLVPVLIFIKDEYDEDYPHILNDLYSSLDKTIAQWRHLTLKKFQLHTIYGSQFESQVNDYIRYAVKCNVQELDLSFAPIQSNVLFELHQMILQNTSFTRLNFKQCVFTPIGAINWTKLRICVSLMRIDEEVIENILSGSPLLETFKLHFCYGYKQIDITSKSVKHLVLTGYIDIEQDVYALKINAPNILTLKVEEDLCSTKPLLLNVSSLVKADLDYTNCWLDATRRKHEEMKMLKGLILSLRHVKELKIGSSCSKALSGLKAKGFTIPSNTKCPDITSCLSFDSEDES